MICKQSAIWRAVQEDGQPGNSGIICTLPPIWLAVQEDGRQDNGGVAEWLRSSHLSITPGHAGGWPGDCRPLCDNRLWRSRPTIQRYTLCRKGRLLRSRLNTICLIPPVNLRYDWGLLKGSSSWAIIHTWYWIFLTLLSLRTQFFTTGNHSPYSSLHKPFSNYT